MATNLDWTRERERAVPAVTAAGLKEGRLESQHRVSAGRRKGNSLGSQLSGDMMWGGGITHRVAVYTAIPGRCHISPPDLSPTLPGPGLGISAIDLPWLHSHTSLLPPSHRAGKTGGHSLSANFI